MPEGIDRAADAFRDALGATEKVVQTRDDRGRFAESSARPEPLFAERRTEGDEFGDTRDGGEDARLRRQEERANGEPFEQELPRRQREDVRKQSVRTSGNEEHERAEEEQGGPEDQRTGDDDHDDEPDEGTGAEQEPEQDAESGERYEVTVDGQPKEVSLREALDGYIRTETFHTRMNQVNDASQSVQAEAQRVAQMRDHYIQQAANLEQEILTLLPKEPDWDTEYTRDPKAAYELRKQYDAVNGKLNDLRMGRDKAQQERAADQARNTENYAKQEFAKFVMDSKFRDEGSLRKEINSMRKTAMSLGFSEAEVASVYDSRMLKVLYKAAQWDRLQAKTPKPIIPGKGRTLTPGNAPRIGNTGRRSIEEAQSRLAKSGRLDDAASVFEKILR